MTCFAINLSRDSKRHFCDRINLADCSKKEIKNLHLRFILYLRRYYPFVMAENKSRIIKLRNGDEIFKAASCVFIIKQSQHERACPEGEDEGKEENLNIIVRCWGKENGHDHDFFYFDKFFKNSSNSLPWFQFFFFLPTNLILNFKIILN